MVSEEQSPQPWEDGFLLLALFKGGCFGVGVQTCPPEPHVTPGGLQAGGAGRWQQQLLFA